MKSAYIAFLVTALITLSACGQEATRGDFKKSCAGMLGRWGGEVTSVIHDSKCKKTGNTYTVYGKARLAVDGNVMILSNMGGTTSVRAGFYFDAAAKRFVEPG